MRKRTAQWLGAALVAACGLNPQPEIPLRFGGNGGSFGTTDLSGGSTNAPSAGSPGVPVVAGGGTGQDANSIGGEAAVEGGSGGVDAGSAGHLGAEGGVR